MSYDFFVFPAERADDVEEATALYESSSQRGSLTPGGAMDSFLTALGDVADRDALLRADPAGHDGSAYVCTSWTDPMTNLHTVAGLAARCGLAVLDVQLTALYDPRGAVAVELQTEGGPRLPYLTRPLLRGVVSMVLDAHFHWLNLARSDHVYCQAYFEDGDWDVEHRAGDPHQHFTARCGDTALVEDLLWSWAADDGRWRTTLDFTPTVV